MSKPTKKPVFGVIGGIGAGKSTVAQAFADLGCAVIDADVLAHLTFADPAVITALVAQFGPEVRSADGQIDRHQISEHVFSDPQALITLEALIHPLVLADCERLLLEHQENPAIPAIILDMPLLLEVGWASRCDRIIFVKCSHDLRKKRLTLKQGPDDADMGRREKFQFSLDRKESLAHNIVHNNSDVLNVVRQVTEIFREIVNF